MGVARRIERNWVVKHTKDYTFEEPAASGYRALHVVVERDQRLIEIQLRTPRQHAWSEAVERTDKRLGINLKGGEGPADLLNFFRLAGHGMALEERGESADPEFRQEFNDVYAAVSHYVEKP